MDGSELERMCLDVIARLARAQQQLCVISEHFDPGMLDAGRKKQIAEDASAAWLLKFDLESTAETLGKLHDKLKTLG